MDNQGSLKEISDKTSIHRNDTLESQQIAEVHDISLEQLGYKSTLRRDRGILTLLFQSLAIAAIPYGEGGPLISSIYGGGQLSIFVGWIIVLILDECVALSLSEIVSRYPTAGGPYYWSFALAGKSSNRKFLAFLTGWIWVVGNWTITLSVNFGFASLIAATISIYLPNFTASSWQLLLIFYAVCLLTFFICAYGNKLLPKVDTVAAIWTLVTILATLIGLSVTANVGRHSAADTLGYYDTSLSGWGGFTFFIGLLPAAYTFSAIGMICSMAEEAQDPAVEVPRAMSLCVPVGGIVGFFFIIPICATLPPLADVADSPYGQALPYIYHVVMGTPGGGLALSFLVLLVTLFCSISITTAASRCTWAFARDNALPLASVWSKLINNVPIPAIGLVTIVEALLGLINLGSSSAFTAFVSVGVIALAATYAIPIAQSLLNKRREVSMARWNCGSLIGTLVNLVSLFWIAFELVLFSMPTVLPVTEVSMNYASVVFVGFGVLGMLWYAVYARKHFNGPPAPETEALR